MKEFLGEIIPFENLFYLPPKTTECTAPKRTVASIEMTASGIKGISIVIDYKIEF